MRFLGHLAIPCLLPLVFSYRLVRAFLRQQMMPLLVLQLKAIERLLDQW
jgi:hypothetical protein